MLTCAIVDPTLQEHLDRHISAKHRLVTRLGPLTPTLRTPHHQPPAYADRTALIWAWFVQGCKGPCMCHLRQGVRTEVSVTVGCAGLMRQTSGGFPTREQPSSLSAPGTAPACALLTDTHAHLFLGTSYVAMN